MRKQSHMSLRGAKRRSNLKQEKTKRLLRSARNDSGNSVESNRKFTI